MKGGEEHRRQHENGRHGKIGVVAGVFGAPKGAGREIHENASFRTACLQYTTASRPLQEGGGFLSEKRKNSSFEPHNIFSIAHRRAFVKRKTGNVTIFRRLPKFAPEASVILPS
jgi:hypothetical protein